MWMSNVANSARAGSNLRNDKQSCKSVPPSCVIPGAGTKNSASIKDGYGGTKLQAFGDDLAAFHDRFGPLGHD